MKRLAWLLVAAALLALAARQRTPAEAAPPPTSWMLEVLATRANAAESALWLVDAAGRAREVARVAHLPGATVRGVPASGGRVLVVADRAPGSDRSWRSSLLVLEPGRAARELCDRVDHASRPLVLDDRRALVSRGRAGTAPASAAASPAAAARGALRVDELSIDEVELATGATREVWRSTGWQAHLAGVAGGEAIVYFVAPPGTGPPFADSMAWVGADGAGLLAIDVATGSVRMLASLRPFARDFTIDGAGRVVFAERDDARHDLWTIERVAIASGAHERLLASASQHLAPFAWPGGEVAYADGERGLALSASGLRAPAGAGVDVVRAAAPDGSRAALWHYAPGVALPDVIVVDAAARPLTRVAAPPATRLEIVGFAPGAAP
jgi:hypothetical protein